MTEIKRTCARTAVITFLVGLACATFLAVMLTGLWRSAKRGDDARAILETESRVADLLIKYREVSAGEARDCLLKAAALVEGAKLSEYAKAGLNEFIFMRLFVLEKRLGDNILAEGYLVKARYWYLRRENLSLTPDVKAAHDVMGLTPSKIEELVDEFDNAKTGGRGPAYLQHMPVGSPSHRSPQVPSDGEKGPGTNNADH